MPNQDLYGPDTLSVAQPTVSKHVKAKLSNLMMSQFEFVLRLCETERDVFKVVVGIEGQRAAVVALGQTGT